MYLAAVWWSAGEASDASAVLAACDALAAGLDGPGLRQLAGVSLRHADGELRDLIGPALADLGLSCPPRDSVEGDLSVLRVLAAMLVAGVVPPCDLTRWTHRTFGHDGPPVTGELVRLDDQYGIFDFDERPVADLDAEVAVEAHRVLGGGLGVSP